MPDIHPVTGEWCAGVGRSVVSRERGGELARDAGDAYWLGDDPAYQREIGPRAFLETAGRELDPHGANRFRAGGREWGAFLDDGSGYRDSHGNRNAAWNVGGVGPDGTVAIILDRSEGLGIRLLAADGTYVDIPDARPDEQDVKVVDRATAAWTEQGHRVVRSIGLASFAHDDGQGGRSEGFVTYVGYWLDVVRITGVWYALYQDEHDRLLFHRIGDYMGKVIAQGNAFRPRVSADGTRIVYARNQGERPADIVVVDPRALPLVDLRVTVSAPPVQPPVQPPVEPPKEPPVSLRTIPMPARIPQIVQALYERHVDLAEGDDDQRRQLQILICQQARFELGPEWGSKISDPGHPQSKDSIACLTGGVLYSADCFNGSTRKPSVPNVLEEIPGQIFSEVPPVDSLGVGQPPPVDPPPVQPPSDLEQRIAALERERAVIRQTVDGLSVRVTALEQRPQDVPGLPPTVPPAADGAATEASLRELVAGQRELVELVKGALKKIPVLG